jgi:hypothetical protein
LPSCPLALFGEGKKATGQQGNHTLLYIHIYKPHTLKNRKFMSTIYRFHLEKYRPGSKTTCPACGHHKRFSHYIDEENKITFPDFVGKCDRVDSCGYNYTPKQYFEEHGFKKLFPHYNVWQYPTHWIAQKTQRPTSYIPRTLMQQSLSHYPENALYQYLSTIMPPQEVLQLFQRYHVGTAKAGGGGSTVFWQVDAQDRVHTGKVITYDPATGHRLKDYNHHITWAHSLLKIKDFNLEQSLFGADQIPQRPDDTIAIVESEKTAIIATHYAPQYLWLATGGKTMCFNPEALAALKGRKIIMVPDLQGLEEWRSRIKYILSSTIDVYINPQLEAIATDQERQQGLDIADFLVQGIPLDTLLKPIHYYPPYNKKNPNNNEQQ